MSDEQRCPVPGHCPQASEVAEAAARTAVKRVFAILGVNVDVPKEVEKFREDLRFGSAMRRLANRGALAMVGAIAVGITIATWHGIVAFFKGG